MNQHQRKFLLDEIEKRYKLEKDELRKREPKEPSLNNYLVAAILDGSFVMKDPSVVRESLRKRVRDLGKGESLLGGGRSSWRDESEDGSITLPAELLFDRPVSYAEAMDVYDAAKAAWKSEMDALDASIAAMRIKVQIGSDKALDALVLQADTLCSMSLASSNRLLLSAKAE
jgi:hypothetical protein